MAEQHIPDHSVHEPTTAQMHPVVTTPQGTQANGVETGHEHRDVDVMAIGRWLVLLLVVAISVHLVTWIGFGAMNRYYAQADTPASPVMAVRQAPPEPRVLPNPTESRVHPEEPMLGPGAVGAADRRGQVRELEAHGLWDTRTNEPALPPDSLAVLGKENPAAAGRPPAAGSTLRPLPAPSGSTRTNGETPR